MVLRTRLGTQTLTPWDDDIGDGHGGSNVGVVGRFDGGIVLMDDVGNLATTTTNVTDKATRKAFIRIGIDEDLEVHELAREEKPAIERLLAKHVGENSYQKRADLPTLEPGKVIKLR